MLVGDLRFGVSSTRCPLKQHCADQAHGASAEGKMVAAIAACGHYRAARPSSAAHSGARRQRGGRMGPAERVGVVER